jgi:hypothetical protein
MPSSSDDEEVDEEKLAAEKAEKLAKEMEEINLKA